MGGSGANLREPRILGFCHKLATSVIHTARPRWGRLARLSALEDSRRAQRSRAATSRPPINVIQSVGATPNSWLVINRAVSNDASSPGKCPAPLAKVFPSEPANALVSVRTNGHPDDNLTSPACKRIRDDTVQIDRQRAILPLKQFAAILDRVCLFASESDHRI